MGELELAADAPSPARVDTPRQLIAAWLFGFPSEHTRRSYSGDLTAWLTFCDEHGVEPLSARRPQIDAWARSLEELNLKPRTIARRLSSVSSWYDFLVTEQVCAMSPARFVRRPKIADRGETPGLTRDELRRLMTAAKEYGSLRTSLC